MSVAVLIAQAAVLLGLEQLDLGGNPNLVLIGTSLAFYMVGYIVLYLSLSWRKTPTLRIEKQKIQAKKVFLYFCMGYFLLKCGNQITLGIISLMTVWAGEDILMPVSELSPGLNPLLSLLITMVGAPIFEELFFRKFIIDKLQIQGVWPSVLVSALLFGLYHVNLFQFIYAFLVGVFLGYLYLKNGNLVLCILIHSLLNGMGYADYLLQNLFIPGRIFEVLAWSIILTGGICFILRLRENRVEWLKEYKNGISSVKAIFNIGMLVVISYYVILMTAHLW